MSAGFAVGQAYVAISRDMKVDLKDTEVQGSYFDMAEPNDLVTYGLIPEFIGRFPLVVSTRGLDLDQMVMVLTQPKNAVIKQYKYLFAMSDVDFHITDDALEEIANVALSKRTGARGLRSILENMLMEVSHS